MNPQSVFQSHQSRILAYFRRKTRSPELAEDLCQQTFLLITAHFRELQQQEAAFKWVWTIAHNVWKGHLRTHAAQKREALTVDIDPSELSYQPNLDHHIDQTILVQHLRRCIAELPEQMRRIIALKDLSGQKLEDTARVLNLRAGTVKSSRHRALIRLKKCLEESLNQP